MNSPGLRFHKGAKMLAAGLSVKLLRNFVQK
jgi:hypothetical protein